MCCSMKYGGLFGLVVAATVAGSFGFAQPEKPKLPKAPDAVKQPEAPKVPEVPGMDEWMKSMMPGKEHARLAKAVGTWDGALKMWMMPGAPASESTCVSEFKSILGGRYIECITTGMMDMGGQKMPFEGRGLYGFNNVTKKYESTWIDNMGTGFMNATGSVSEDGAVMNWTATCADPMTGQMMTMREVDTHKDANSSVLEMFGPGPDGKEFRMMEITYSRKK